MSRFIVASDVMDRWVALKSVQLEILGQRNLQSGGSELDYTEFAWIEPDGFLTLGLDVPNVAEISMRLQPHEWNWAQPDEAATSAALALGGLPGLQQV